MRIGIPRESKEGEHRVALLPRDVAALVAAGHAVVVEHDAGRGIGEDDERYRRAGATIGEAKDAWSRELVVKVKEILEPDLAHLPRGATVFGFHHLPGEPERTRELARRAITAIAFEMVRDEHGGFPLLAPMSVIAGRMAVERVWPLAASRRPRVLVLGAGHAGSSAAHAARERGAAVTVLTRSERSRASAERAGFAAALATPEAIERAALESDLVVGAVFIPAQATPKLLPRSLVRRMKHGAIIADISIDAGGVAETSRPTTHAEPTFVEEGVVHYCVGNIPAADPAASAAALSAALRPFVEALAARGVAEAIRRDPRLRAGVVLWQGRVSHPGIAAEAGLPYTALSEEVLA